MSSTLESIYREHRQGLFSLALSITRRRDRAEDAVHDAFARLIRGGGAGVRAAGNLDGAADSTPGSEPEAAPGAGADSVAYAYAAVRNAAIDILRKRCELPIESFVATASARSIYEPRAGGAAAPALATTARESDGAADAPLVVSETEQAVRDAVDELPEPTKQVVVMKIYGGMTFEQIAQVLGEPPSTVASRYRRALEKLKERLESLAA